VNIKFIIWLWRTIFIIGAIMVAGFLVIARSWEFFIEGAFALIFFWIMQQLVFRFFLK